MCFDGLTAEQLLVAPGVSALERDIFGNEFAHCLASITLQWGQIEHQLFWLLQAIDRKEATSWARTLFSPSMQMSGRKASVRKHVLLHLQANLPEIVPALDRQLGFLRTIQDRRNLLAHGFWNFGAQPKTFKIQPLAFKADSETLDENVVVDLDFVQKLLRDIDAWVQDMATLASEVMAHQQLLKWRDP